MNYGFTLVPGVTATKAVLFQDTVLPARRRGEHSEWADHVSTGEKRWSATHTGSAPASSTVAHLGNVAQVETLLPVITLQCLICSTLSSCNTSCLAIFQARKVVGVAATASVDELLALPIVVVKPVVGGFG